MSYQITLQPDQQFTAKAYNSILESAALAGINLPYGCKNGACGSCKGEIVAGNVDYGDYTTSALTESEKSAGKALFCCARPLSDLTIACREVLANVTPPRIIPARVERKEKLANDVMALFLKLPSSEHLQFKAGQYIEFLLKDGQRRAFSLANSPHIDNVLELHIRLVAGGQFTHYVFNEMSEKAIMRIEAPLGSFFLREETNKPIIMLATGTGFAPIKGIIEHIIQQDIKRDVTIYWGGRTKNDLYQMDLAKSWSTSQANIQFVPVLSRPAAEDAWQGKIGYVQQAALDDFSQGLFKNSQLKEYEVYCCGSPLMVESAHASFMAAGLADEAFFSDAFTFAKPSK